MSLYLAVFDDSEENELEGVEVGRYSDFARFRDQIAGLEPSAASKYPTLLSHSDSDGEWSPGEAKALLQELDLAASELRKRPPLGDPGEWQAETLKSLGFEARTLFDSFIDVDGEPLIERLQDLCRVSIQHNQPIRFQ